MTSFATPSLPVSKLGRGFMTAAVGKKQTGIENFDVMDALYTPLVDPQH